MLDRLLGFAVSGSQVALECSRKPMGGHFADQLIRSCTAPAAHRAEAIDAESRRDFIHKMKLAVKELRESLVWLQIIEQLGLVKGEQLNTTAAEGNELIAIIVASITKARCHGQAH